MKLIVGLGNPGEQYDKTRHNVGFSTINAFAEAYGFQWKMVSKLKGMISEVLINGNKALLLKPLTYMNLSGESVSAVMNYYKIDVHDILVIADDLDSPVGRVRLRASGSAGGHNGLKNIIKMIGTEEYKRIKIGIDRSATIPVVDWVLSRFNADDSVLIQAAIEKSMLAIKDFVNNIEFTKIASLYSEK